MKKEDIADVVINVLTDNLQDLGVQKFLLTQQRNDTSLFGVIEDIMRDIELRFKEEPYLSDNQELDLGDLGNLIGMAIGKYTMFDNSTQLGLSTDEFIFGLEHGISLIDGTH